MAVVAGQRRSLLTLRAGRVTLPSGERLSLCDSQGESQHGEGIRNSEPVSYSHSLP